MSSVCSTDNNISAKLRRLKIQEGILLSHVNKCMRMNSVESDGNIKYDNELQLTNYFCKLKDSFREIRNSFEEITDKTNNREYFEVIDVNDVKRDILELDKKIITLKQFITEERQGLVNEESMCTRKNTHSSPNSRRIKDYNPPKKAYKQIVPSPVSFMINSPFKCSEVQKFQDFMKHSPNRYGGWNEYNHNMFVQIWNKYYEDAMILNVNAIHDTFSYRDFKYEVLHKITGARSDDIDSHSNWYSEYLRLKVNQQKALNKWRENKMKIKRAIRKEPMDNENSTFDKLNNIVDNNTFWQAADLKETDKLSRKRDSWSTLESATRNSDNRAKIDVLKLMRPTKQWLKRQQMRVETLDNYNNISNISKLRIPTWRLKLND